MNDLIRNNKKASNKRILQTSQNQKNNNDIVASNKVEESFDRACNQNQHCNQQPAYNQPCNCINECHDNHHHNDCCGCSTNCCSNNDECTENCFANPCGEQCGYPLSPAKFNTSQASMYPIETNRVYDTMMFRVFTDGKTPGGSDLGFNYTLGELCGPLPCSATTNVTIEKVCINYDDITIIPGTTSLEQLDIEPICDCSSQNCQSIFEYNVCGQLNKCCNSKCMGQNVAFKEKGLQVVVSGLEIELTGKFGCSEFTAVATPQSANSCESNVVFYFNTLSGDIVVPSNGKSFVLREEFQTQLTVDCICKGVITQSTVNNQPYYSLSIPNGIDLICCLQNVVSVLMEEQIVVLGAPTAIQPRLIDTFGSVCDFSQFEENSKAITNNNNYNHHHNHNNNNHCDC